MCGGNPRELASGESQNEFLNHFYWNSSAAGNGLSVAEYADLKGMQPYYLGLSPLTPWQKSLRMFLPPACPAHFLAFHIFPPLLSSITRSWKGKLLPLNGFLILLFFILHKILQLYNIAPRQHKIHWISCWIYFEQITSPLNFYLPVIISAVCGYQST